MNRSVHFLIHPASIYLALFAPELPAAGPSCREQTSGRKAVGVRKDLESGPSDVAAFLLINRLALDRNSKCRHWGSLLLSYLALHLWSCVYLRLQNSNEENDLTFSFIGIIQSFSNSLGPTAIQVCLHLHPVPLTCL